MNDTSIQIEIDCLATARRILSSPVAVYAATPFEIVAMAACTVRESSGSAPELPVIGERPSELPASLAAQLQTAIHRWDELAKVEAAYARAANEDDPNCGAIGESYVASQNAFEDAFNILIARFEKEFPIGSDQ